MKRWVLLVLPLVSATACSSSSSGTTLTDPTTTAVLTTDILAGTVPPPVNGTLQSDMKTFKVTQANGTTTITLTSAIETLPGGSLLTNVNMGLSVGSLSGTTCTTLTNGSVVGSAGINLSGTLQTGSYCVRVADVTNQLGPVAYAVAAEHP